MTWHPPSYEMRDDFTPVVDLCVQDVRKDFLPLLSSFFPIHRISCERFAACFCSWSGLLQLRIAATGAFSLGYNSGGLIKYSGAGLVFCESPCGSVFPLRCPESQFEVRSWLRRHDDCGGSFQFEGCGTLSWMISYTRGNAWWPLAVVRLGPKGAISSYAEPQNAVPQLFTLLSPPTSQS